MISTSRRSAKSEKRKRGKALESKIGRLTVYKECSYNVQSLSILETGF